jgi:nucleoside-diphosphate-sugar epimerase
MQPGDVPTTPADTSLLTEWTGHNPGTPIREGIQMFVDWHRHWTSPIMG